MLSDTVRWLCSTDGLFCVYLQWYILVKTIGNKNGQTVLIELKYDFDRNVQSIPYAQFMGFFYWIVRVVQA